MRCPKCRGRQTTVIDGGRQRYADQPETYWRRRRCLTCQHRWNTLEIPTARLKPKPAKTA